MQSGRKKAVSRGNAWVLEYPRSAAVHPDALMGWQSSADTKRQVRMYFPDRAIDGRHIQQTALTAGIDSRHAGDLGGFAIGKIDAQQPAATFGHQNRIMIKEFHAPWVAKRRPDPFNAGGDSGCVGVALGDSR